MQFYCVRTMYDKVIEYIYKDVMCKKSIYHNSVLKK